MKKIKQINEYTIYEDIRYIIVDGDGEYINELDELGWATEIVQQLIDINNE